jgi:hypothetical protein
LVTALVQLMLMLSCTFVGAAALGDTAAVPTGRMTAMPIPQDDVNCDELETVLVHCWEAALRRQPISVHDDFFALGGHSLVAMRIAHRLRRALGIELEYVLVLEHPTIAELARSLRESDIPEAELVRAGREYLRAKGPAAS